MKKLLPVVLLFCLIATIYAAFTCTENFDSYTAGTDLNNGSGGTNWTDFWFAAAGAWVVQTVPAGGMTGKAAKNTTTNNFTIRSFAATNAGTCCVKMQLSITNPNSPMGFSIADVSNDEEIFVSLGPTGNVEVYSNAAAGYVSLGVSYSANTPVTVCVQWDNVAQPNSFRASVNGGAYSAWYIVQDGTYTTLTILRLKAEATGTRDFWVDDIDNVVIGGSSSKVPILVSERRRRNQ